MAYAQKCPEQVIAAVFGAVTTGSRREIDWITRAMGRVFPQQWEQFVAAVPDSERAGNLPAAYARLLADPDPEVRRTAAMRWCAWEDTHVSLMPGWQPNPRYDDPAFRSVFARLVTHYWSHDCFLAPNEILDGWCPRRHPGDPGARTLRRVRAVGHRVGDRAGLARQPVGRARRRGHGGEGFAAAVTAAVDSFNAS